MKTKPKPRKLGRPATGKKTPKRYCRISDDFWQQIIDAAGASGEMVSEYLRRVLLRDAKRVLKRDE